MKKIGRYQIVREIGRGETGVVYQALDPKFRRPVVVKTIAFSTLDSAEDSILIRERFLREERIAASTLIHPNIVAVYDVFQKHGDVHIVMEFVNGKTLDKALAELLQQPVQRRLEILEEAAAALDYAHMRGIFHRGISPAKIMIDDRGHAKIAGFGRAQLAENKIRFVPILEPLHYMAPEQVKFDLLTEHVDQFALAAVAYVLSTGRKPFAGDAISRVLYQIVCEPAVEPSSLNHALGPQVDYVLQKAMAKSPKNRFDSCIAFIRALGAGVEGKYTEQHIE